MERSGGGCEGEGVCGDAVAALVVRERWSLVILSVKKEAKLSASELSDVKEGNGDEYLRCNSLSTV